MSQQRFQIPLLAVFLPLALANLNYLSPAPNLPEYAVRSPPTLHARALPPPTPLTFTHGIASGDPHADTVILWTRAIPPGVDEYRHVYSSNSPKACVAWQISPTKDFANITDAGETVTTGDIDYTVKVDAQGLEPKTHYYYRFGSCGDGGESGDRGWSEVGRTKTLPAPDDPVQEGIKIAVYSCSNYAAGWFNVYGMSARKDSVDYVLHLGDYIYEFPTPTDNPERISRPLKEAISLRDYRLRHATHKTDPDLLHNHRMFPIIPIWDDHEREFLSPSVAITISALLLAVRVADPDSAGTSRERWLARWARFTEMADFRINPLAYPPPQRSPRVL